jgi:hypothetical protein
MNLEAYMQGYISKVAETEDKEKNLSNNNIHKEAGKLDWLLKGAPKVGNLATDLSPLAGIGAGVGSYYLAEGKTPISSSLLAVTLPWAMHNTRTNIRKGLQMQVPLKEMPSYVTGKMTPLTAVKGGGVVAGYMGDTVLNKGPEYLKLYEDIGKNMKATTDPDPTAPEGEKRGPLVALTEVIDSAKNYVAQNLPGNNLDGALSKYHADVNYRNKEIATLKQKNPNDPKIRELEGANTKDIEAYKSRRAVLDTAKTETAKQLGLGGAGTRAPKSSWDKITDAIQYPQRIGEHFKRNAMYYAGGGAGLIGAYALYKYKQKKKEEEQALAEQKKQNKQLAYLKQLVQLNQT